LLAAFATLAGANINVFSNLQNKKTAFST